MDSSVVKGPATTPLFVRECVVDGRRASGITDGTFWFVNAYTRKKRAKAVLLLLDTDLKIWVNVSHRNPLKVLEK